MSNNRTTIGEGAKLKNCLIGETIYGATMTNYTEKKYNKNKKKHFPSTDETQFFTDVRGANESKDNDNDNEEVYFTDEKGTRKVGKKESMTIIGGILSSQPPKNCNVYGYKN